MVSADTWDQLSTVALMGTERTGGAAPAPAALGAILAQLPESDRESRFLASAAAAEVYLRAGAKAAAFNGQIPTAPDETLPRISIKSAGHLQLILSDATPFPQELISEWLAACAAARKRVHERQLPLLLDFAIRHADLRPHIAAILGARGTWLASLNPDWRDLFTLPGTDDWETAPRDARIAMLTHLRRTDAGAARALLEQTWKHESFEDRSSFLPILAHNLSLADEPFIESALDDKRKEVRQTAADLLATLPNSAYSQRMLTRASALVTFTAGKTGLVAAITGRAKSTITATLPGTLTPDAERDGISAKPRAEKLGEKAFQLAQILAGTPLDHWTTAADLVPADIIAIAKKHEFAGALQIGWSRAAIRQKNIPWAEALVVQWFATGTEDLGVTWELLQSLIAALPPESREYIITLALSRVREALDGSLLLAMIDAATHPWSLPFSRTMAGEFARALADSHNRYQYQFRDYMHKRAGLYLHTAIAPELADLLKPAASVEYNNKMIDAVLAIVQFRYDMLKELAP